MRTKTHIGGTARGHAVLGQMAFSAVALKRAKIILSKIPVPCLLFAVALMMLFANGQAGAAPVKIVALGASNTAGKGVGLSAAWPAQLEAMLRAKGYDATVANAGISGDDTGRMLARLDGAVPDGTKLVIMEKAATNDRIRNVDTEANVRTIAGQLKARGIRLIVIPGVHGWANRQIQSDGIHITEQGHIAVASHLLPLVTAAVRK
jgi:acyl-CoA thioesterase I